MSNPFRSIPNILSDLDITGGGLAGRGDQHPAGDYDEYQTTLDTNLYWEIRNISNHNEKYTYRDLQQFALEVRGSIVHMEGINKIASPQMYPRSENHSFNVPPKAGTTGDITDYEARLVKVPRPVIDIIPPMSQVISTSTIVYDPPDPEPEP